MCVCARNDNQRTPVYTLLDPKLAVDSIYFLRFPEPQKLTLT